MNGESLVSKGKKNWDLEFGRRFKFGVHTLKSLQLCTMCLPSLSLSFLNCIMRITQNSIFYSLAWDSIRKWLPSTLLGDRQSLRHHRAVTVCMRQVDKYSVLGRLEKQPSLFTLQSLGVCKHWCLPAETNYRSLPWVNISVLWPKLAFSSIQITTPDRCWDWRRGAWGGGKNSKRPFALN